MTDQASAPNDPEGQSKHSIQNLTATAYHEAGHAVMALSLDRPIQKVTIKPGRSEFGQRRLGVCKIGKAKAKASRNLIEDEILILFAGMVAESQFTGKYCERGAAEDLRLIARLLEDRVSTQKQFDRLHRRLLDKTEHELSDEVNANAIELIAKELIEKETISGRAVRHFYGQAGG